MLPAKHLAPLFLALTAASGLSAQDAKETPAEKPAQKEAPAETDRDSDSKTTPKRLGGDRLKGIKVKPRVVTPAPSPIQGPQPVPPAAGTEGHDEHDGHDHAPTSQVASPQGKGAMTIEGGNQIQDFGELVQGETRDHTFRAKSTGEEPLVIATLTKSCGCTRAEIKLVGEEGELLPYRLGAGIEPGTEFVLEATLDTTGKTNRLKSDISLTTNDPRRSLGFSLSAQVNPALSANPRSLNLGQMRGSETRKGQVVLTSEAFGKFKLELDANIPLRGVTCELVPTEPDAEGKSDRWVAKITAGPNLPEGAFNQALRFVSDLPQEGKTMPDGSPLYFDSIFYTVAQVIGPIQVNPPHVSFGLLRPGQALTRRTKITVTDEEYTFPADPVVTLKGYGVDFPYPDDFEVQLVPIEGTRDIDLVVNLLGIDDIEGNGSFRGFVEIQLDHPGKPTIDVGFSGVIRAGVGQPSGR